MPSSWFWSSGTAVFSSAFLLRAALLIYGHIQDQNSALKYTDIDYYVFTDAARYVSRGKSPYDRDTYRYTPLLAWMLLPTTWGGLWFDFGKALFALSDIVAGWLAFVILLSNYDMPKERSLQFASLWLLNPMVAQISTRGSSEGILALMVMCLLWAALQRKYWLTGIIIGVSVHFKIYPFIYAGSVLWWLDTNITDNLEAKLATSKNVLTQIKLFANPARLKVAWASFLTFLALNTWMIVMYGEPFLQHTFFYHLIRTDHRHNFSPYNILLYLKSSPAGISDSHPEALAFAPQLFLSVIALPLVLAKKDLASCMLAQTFAFVTLNKVCTSQYFLWYMVFLPFYLPNSTLLDAPRIGIVSSALWVGGQALWLQQGYQLEFLGQSTFIPGLWLATIAFFGINIWILGIVIFDIRNRAPSISRLSHMSAHKSWRS